MKQCPSCGVRNYELACRAMPLDCCLEKKFDILACTTCGYGCAANSNADLDALYNACNYESSEDLPFNVFKRNRVALKSVTKVTLLFDVTLTVLIAPLFLMTSFLSWIFARLCKKSGTFIVYAENPV